MTDKYVKSLRFGKDGEKYIIKDAEAQAKIAEVEAKVDAIEMPDIANLATKEEVAEKVDNETYEIKMQALDAAIEQGQENADDVAAKVEDVTTKVDALDEKAVKFDEFTYTNSDGETSTRKTVQLANYDSISGVATDGKGHNLVMLSKWDVADFGAPGVHANLNTKDVVTINDDLTVATTKDIEAAIDEVKETYATKEELEEAAPDLSNLATKSYVDTKVVEAAGGNIELTDYAKVVDLEKKQDKFVVDDSLDLKVVNGVVSKNFVNPDAEEEDGYFIEDGTKGQVGGFHSFWKMPIEPNKRYLYSFESKATSSFRLILWDKDNNFIKQALSRPGNTAGTRIVAAFETTSDTALFSISMNGEATPLSIKAQVELMPDGLEPTEYDPTYEFKTETVLGTKKVAPLKINGVKLTSETTGGDLGLLSYFQEVTDEYTFDSEEIVENTYVNAAAWAIGYAPNFNSLSYPTNEFNIIPQFEVAKGGVITIAGNSGNNSRLLGVVDKETNKVVYVSPAAMKYTEKDPLVYTCESDSIVLIQPRRQGVNPIFHATVHQIIDTTPTVNGIKITDNPEIKSMLIEHYTGDDITDNDNFSTKYYYGVRTQEEGDIFNNNWEAGPPGWGSYRFNLYPGDKIKVTNVGGTNAKGFCAVSKATNEILKLVITTSTNPKVEYTATEPVLVTGGINTANYIGIFDVEITRDLNCLYKTLDNIKLSSNTSVVATAGAGKFLNPKPNYYKDELRILDIGNSFTQDPTYYISDLVQNLGVDTSKIAYCTAIRGGSTFKNWYDIYYLQDGTNNPKPSRLFGGASVDFNTPAGESHIKYALEHNTWDIIIIHQVSGSSNNHANWEGTGADGYLKELVRLLRFHQPQAHIGFLMVHSSYSNDHDTLNRWEGIAKATRYMQEQYNMDVIIPVGTAVQNVRASKIAENSTQALCGDGHHLGWGVGRYTACLAYYEALLAPYFKKSMYGSTYMPPAKEESVNNLTVTVANQQACQMAAMLAVSDMYTVTNPDGLYVGPVPTIPDPEEPEDGGGTELTYETRTITADECHINSWWHCGADESSSVGAPGATPATAKNGPNQSFIALPGLPNKTKFTVEKGYAYRINYWNPTTGAQYRGGYTTGNNLEQTLNIPAEYTLAFLNFTRVGENDSTLNTVEHCTELLTHIQVKVPVTEV